MMKKIILILAMLFSFSAASAQEAEIDDPEPAIVTDVYVTTQDFSSLRTGPGQGFPRLTVIDPVVTLPAVGRTSDTRWIQVYHEGQYGWIAAILLVWSGDVITLPVDGVNPTPFIRRAGALGRTTRETPIYRSQVTPEDQVGVLPAGTEVELTGRLGGTGYFDFQIVYQGQLYWVGSWNIKVIDGTYHRLLDIAYLYPYGRLVSQLERNIAQSIGSFAQISSVWQRLSQGDRVSCTPIPLFVRRLITDTDAQKEPNFVPAVLALDNAITSINTAISSFEDACGSDDVLGRGTIDTALAEIDNAERNLILAGSLIEPLRRRNPLLDTQDQ
jgi:hypothetical protein